MRKLHIDFETRSATDLKKCGAWAYAKDPTTDVLCLAYSLDGAPVKVLTAKDLAGPYAMAEFPLGPDVVLVAHSAHFEYAIWNYILHLRYGWPALWAPEKWACTLARAAAANLPISLDACGEALGIFAKKDLVGRAAMMKLCKPVDTDPIAGTPVFNEDLELHEKLYAYCAQDVRAEVEIDSRLPELSETEKAVWDLDLKINRRGVTVDVDLAANAASIASVLTGGLNAELSRITGGVVTAASRVAEMKRYLATKGVNAESLNKAAVDELLNDPATDENIKAVLSIRRQVGKSSTAKYATMIQVADRDDQRARGLLQYHAAGTGRWGGRLIQPHNFPKGLDPAAQAAAIDVIKSGDAAMFDLIYGTDSMDTLSGALRGALKAGPEKTLVVADYAAIEARVVLWLAGDETALNKYRKGVNLYVDMAQFIYQNPNLTKKDAKEYAVGKMAILGCGYGMGKDRFKAQCETFGIDVSVEAAAQAVRAYRDKYSRVVQMWYATEAAAKEAIATPGKVTQTCMGLVHFGMDKKREFLICRLPSGRMLRYYRPSVKPIMTDYGPKNELHYSCAGINGRLEEYKTYGGSLVENITQAVARDIMANGMLKAEAAGFEVVLTVHDELVAEIGEHRDEKKFLAEFIKLMCDLPAWADGCPITAEGWVGPRYRK